MDFVKSVSDMIEFADYLVIDLDQPDSIGLSQYYNSEKSLNKLLAQVDRKRRLELGKIAAFEFENLTQDITNPRLSVRQNFQRNSIVSTLHPPMLMLKIDGAYIKSMKQLDLFKKACIKNNFDGIILKSDTLENAKSSLKILTEGDSNLTVISTGRISSGKEIFERIKHGAHAV